MLVSFFNTEILASFAPKHNTGQCVAGGYQLTITPLSLNPLPRNHFTSAFLPGQPACASFGPGGDSRAVNIGSWGSACTCLQPYALETLSTLRLRWKQQKLLLLTAVPKHGYSFGNHLWPLPLWPQVSGYAPWYGLSCFSCALRARNVCIKNELNFTKKNYKN